MSNKTKFSIRRAIALSFLFFAKTIVLSHAIIPHHYHNQIPVASFAHHHHECGLSYDHHSNLCVDPYCHIHGNVEDCKLAEYYIKICKCKQAFLLHHCDTELFFCFLTLFSDYTVSIADDISLQFGQNISHYTKYISQSLGLRAPPFFNCDL